MPEVVEKGKGAAEKGKGALTHKVGPLPLWGWAVAGVVAVFIAKKVGGGFGGGGGAAPGVIMIPGAGASPTDRGGGPMPIVSPSQNVHGGSDTAPGGTPPWWASPPQGGSSPPPFINATSGVPLTGQPSTNGSAGAGPAVTTPTGTPQGGSWWTRLLNPAGNLPAGAAATTIGGVTYSLSSDALARAGITGASAPPAGAAAPVGTTTSAPTGNPFGGIGAGPVQSGGSSAPNIGARPTGRAGVMWDEANL